MSVTSFVQPQQFLEMWTTMSASSLARLDEMDGAFRELQKRSLARAFEVVDESARLVKESLAYSVKLSEEWQKITVENGKRLAGVGGAGEPSPASKAAFGAKNEGA